MTKTLIRVLAAATFAIGDPTLALSTPVPTSSAA